MKSYDLPCLVIIVDGHRDSCKRPSREWHDLGNKIARLDPAHLVGLNAKRRLNRRQRRP